MNEVWRARSGIVARGCAWSSPVLAARIWPPMLGSGLRSHVVLDDVNSRPASGKALVTERHDGP
jgi:hypothetical protein